MVADAQIEYIAARNGVVLIAIVNILSPSHHIAYGAPREIEQLNAHAARLNIFYNCWLPLVIPLHIPFFMIWLTDSGVSKV
jgi:hypothetical protein